MANLTSSSLHFIGKNLMKYMYKNPEKDKVQKEIARLEKQARAENQPKKKFDIVQQIKKLKSDRKSVV